MIQFWMDKGIRGFRLDAIDNIVKDGHGGNDTHSEQIHTYLMEMNQNTYGKSEQILTVREKKKKKNQKNGRRDWKKKDGTACSGETMIFRVSYRALEMTGNRIGKNQQKCWLSFSMG
mgnify:CR=1 FL=1